MNAFMLRLLGKRKSYRRIFQGDDGAPHLDGEVVLADLKKFCDGTSLGFDNDGRIDPYRMAYREGRREVYRRIVEFLNVDDARLIQMMHSMENIDDRHDTTE